ncbi:MAG: DUF3108 domain-containing protein [Flavobacteriales bacterium]
MAHRSMVATAAACLLSFGFAQSSGAPAASGESFPLHSVDHHAFRAGEKLSYVLHYGWLNAGVATLELKESDREIQGRKILHAVGIGESTGAFKAFYKVEDRYETFFDKEGVYPWVFIRRVNEGGYIINQDYIFMQHRRTVTTQDNKTYKVAPGVQDMLSAFYFARTIDYSTAQKGDEFEIPCFMDNKEWTLRMRYVGKETIKVRNGKYRCLKFQPVVQEGRVFKTNDDLNVWITDDANHVPVLAQAKVLVGSIKMELSGYEGLANPIAKQ